MNDWIKWNGGECPIPQGYTGRVETRFRGFEDDEVLSDTMPADRARELRWSHTGGIGDTLAYRLLDAAGSKPSNPKDAIGVKKAKFSVIPAGVLFDVGLAMLEGACKYGRHNYRGAGVRASVYYDAAMGHLADWWEGQNLDPDSGLSHVTKAIASLVVLRDAMFQDMLTDDRPPRSKVSKVDFNGLAAEIIDRHADKAPHHYTQEDDAA